MLTSQKVDFVVKYWAEAKRAGAKYGLNPIIILAQAAQESGWGTSYAVRNRRNFFGIIASRNGSPHWDGVSKSVSTASGLWFRIYPTAEESFSDYAWLIHHKYPSVAAKSMDPAAFARAIALSPYISEKNGDDRSVYERNVRQFAADVAEVVKKKALK